MRWFIPVLAVVALLIGAGSLAAMELQGMTNPPAVADLLRAGVGWGMALLYVVGFPISVYAYVRLQ
jgi:hypothetical protein